MNPFRQYVSEFATLQAKGASLPLGACQPQTRPTPKAGAPSAMIFSPHPDDEAIVGGLPLRLLRERGMRIINVAVTAGSDPERRSERLEEARCCCDVLGFELKVLGGAGLERVDLRRREEDPGSWLISVESVVEAILDGRPDVVFFPHDTDQHRAHIGTHYLLVDALERLPHACGFYTVETEFWGALAAPNLAVELSVEDAGDLVGALSFHRGEVVRNPYHLRLPAWMMDNVRRGVELVGGSGAPAPEFVYAVLYRLRRWERGRFRNILERGRFLSAAENAGVLFPHF